MMQFLDLAINALSLAVILHIAVGLTLKGFLPSQSTSTSAPAPAPARATTPAPITSPDAAVDAILWDDPWAAELPPLDEPLAATTDSISAPATPATSVDYRFGTATPEQAALVEKHSEFIRQYWQQQSAAEKPPILINIHRSTPKSRSSKAKQKSIKSVAKGLPTTTKIIPLPPTTTTSALTLDLIQAKTGMLRGHTYIDINSLPFPLPPGLKSYSVRGRFTGVRLDDLRQAGILILD